MATLLAAIKGSSARVRTLCGLKEGQKSADFSNQGLGPMDCKMMAAEFEFSGLIAALTKLNLLGNPIGALGRGTLSELFEQIGRPNIDM